MKTTSAPQATKKAKKPAAKAAFQNKIRVCLKTAELIDRLSHKHDMPPAVIAGTLAKLGSDVLGYDGVADQAGTDPLGVVMDLLRDDVRPKPKIEIPILVSSEVSEDAEAWVKYLNRPLDVWLAQLVELGAASFPKPGVLKRAIICAEEAYFLVVERDIRESVGEADTEAEKLLKPAAQSVFAKFERALAQGGGDQ